MRILSRTTALATTFAWLVAVPAMAAEQQSGSGQDQSQTPNQSGQLSEEAQGCVDRLQELNQRLIDAGYGRVGPGGYGVYGPGYAAAPGAAPAMYPWGVASSPAADMRLLMRAGYIMAAQDQVEGCQAVVATVEDIGNRFEQAMADGEWSADELQQWRADFIGGAVGVNELQQPLTIDEIENADVRNMNDEDLGDIDEVLVDETGKIRYVVVETGGFLGMGEEDVPVRWDDLKVTASPYQTFILDVTEEQFEAAPRIDEDKLEDEGLTDSSLAKDIDSYWQKTLGGG